MFPTWANLVRSIPDTCNVAATILGYSPNAGVNYFLAVAFGVCTISTILIGVWKRTWSFSVAVGLGCALECAGYTSRIPLATNPCNWSAFQTQLVTIILGPTILCVGLYLTLKHVALAMNPKLSRIPPKLLPFLFVPADVSCLVVQAVGGIIAVKAGGDTGVKDPKMLKVGDRTIIAGICLQVVVLGGFGLVGGNYLARCARWIRSGLASAEASTLWSNKRFRMFLYALVASYIFIMIRCIYRIAEMAGGWGNKIMQDEPSFVVLESFMILVACVLLSSFPPGIFFPSMTAHRPDILRLSSVRKPEPPQNGSESQPEEYMTLSSMDQAHLSESAHPAAH